MKKILFVCILAIAISANADNDKNIKNKEWSYSGATGPDKWEKLSPEYSACAGKNQSPIDLKNLIEAKLKPINFSYQAGGKDILNDGHTVQIDYASGSSITIDGAQFSLQQFHFHAPSENLINGKSYPLEVHLVHADQDGNLAVVAVMFNEGAENKALNELWAAIPTKKNEEHDLKNKFAVENLLPANRDYYRYNGSLTTPPCSEGVRWFVMKEAITASKEQIKTFAHAIPEPNNRPILPVNARIVVQ